MCNDLDLAAGFPVTTFVDIVQTHVYLACGNVNKWIVTVVEL